MAVASPSNDNEASVDSFPSTPLTSKLGSEYGGSDYSSGGVNSKPVDLNEPNYQSDSSVHSRKDADSQSPAYLKSEEYRLLFRLPPDEMLVQDFNCAFQESILLQGHMYLFFRHICFYSNIFGFETKKTIPLDELTCVRKAKTAAIFPNAIEIVAGGKKYFFASFLSRDEAYRLIVDNWSQHCNGTEVLIDHQDLKSEIKSEDSVHILERSNRSEQQTDDPKHSERNKDEDPSGDCKLLSITEDEATLTSNPSQAQDNREENGEDVIVNAEQFPSKEALSWKVEDADAPKVPEHFTKVAESKFPVQIEEFFNLFCSDKAINFIDAFHKKCGDKDFRCTSWSEHAQSGYTRELSFLHPIKIYFGAKFGNCHEVQKFRVYSNSRLTIETSQDVSDVPYADYFRVQGLWVLEGGGNETNHFCTLRVYVNVDFLRRTMWKGKIEQSTVEECREAYALWLNEAHEILKQKNLEKPEDVPSPSKMILSDDAQSEGQERDESHLKRLHDVSNVLQIPLMSSDTMNVVSPRLENSARGGFTVPLFRELLARFSLSLKNQNHLSLFLAIAFVLILLMQVSIIILLSRTPQVHVISQMDYINQIGNPRNDVAEAEAWLEKRVDYLKDEMQTVGYRLENMKKEFGLLIEHFKSLEQQRKARN
ncbi:GRAM domain-containing protein [Ranunculus cassubicifolius]